jgi:hypothetical protein
VVPAAADAQAPWQIPESLLASQRLYRVSYQGPEGKLTFRLTLYLERAEVYQMQASDALGRPIFSLAIEEGGGAIFLDHREQRYCRSLSSAEQRYVPLAHLPLLALPKLLLGVLPMPPAREFIRDEGRVSYQDAQGYLWSARLEANRLESWSLAENGEAIAWWQRSDGVGIFSDRRGGQQVRFTEQVVEKLSRPLAPVEAPSAYREDLCP